MASAETPILIDSNVLIGLLDLDDSLHTQANEQMDALRSKNMSILLLTPVIEETVTCLLYKSKIAAVKDLMKQIILDDSVVVLDCLKSDLFAAFDLLLKEQFKPKMSLTDWVLLHCALTTKISLLSFDKQLSNTWKKLA